MKLSEHFACIQAAERESNDYDARELIAPVMTSVFRRKSWSERHENAATRWLVTVALDYGDREVGEA